MRLLFYILFLKMIISLLYFLLLQLIPILLKLAFLILHSFTKQILSNWSSFLKKEKKRKRNDHIYLIWKLFYSSVNFTAFLYFCAFVKGNGMLLGTNREYCQCKKYWNVLFTLPCQWLGLMGAQRHALLVFVIYIIVRHLYFRRQL